MSHMSPALLMALTGALMTPETPTEFEFRLRPGERRPRSRRMTEAEMAEADRIRRENQRLCEEEARRSEEERKALRAAAAAPYREERLRRKREQWLKQHPEQA